MTQQVIRTVCPHDCPDQCSILATVKDGQVLKVAGDPNHAFTGGWLCGKVSRYPERVHSPERLVTPLRRTGPKGSGQFTPITWEEALTEIGQRWRSTIDAFGSEALMGYAYSAHMGRVNRNIVKALFHALGASQVAEGTVCSTTADAGWTYAVGPTPGTDPETVVDSDLVVCWGANVATTNAHFLPFIEEARKRGARLVVIDPYRTRTARRADWHIAPRVGTDTALALGLMHVLVRDGLYDATYVQDHTVGFEALQEKVLPEYSPDRVAEITGVPSADIERLARMYGEARAPFLRLGMGLSRHAGGGMAIRTVACLPALVGAWGKPGGGALMMTGAAWSFDLDAVRRPDLLPRPVRTINHSLLGEALIDLNDPPVMALFVASNNPAVSCPDQQRVIAGLSRDDLFTVVHDTFLSDTALYADIVLPACTAFETEDLYRSYGTYYAQYGPQVIEPLAESRSNLWVVQALAERLGLTDPIFRRTAREHMEALLAGATGPTAEISLERLLEGGPVRLNWTGAGPERTCFYSPQMECDGLPPLPVWAPDPAEQAERAEFPLQLLTAPGHSQHHTAFAGVAALQRQEGAPRCLLHPQDAAARGISDGDPVEVFNHRGFVGLDARVTEDTQPGVLVLEGLRGRSHYRSGGPVNVLTGSRLADMGGGATFQSTWVDVRRYGTFVPIVEC